MSIKIVITGFAVSMLSFLMATPTWAAYETKSRFKTDYKCISDEMGGFNHGKNEHKLTRFNGNKEFFLTHISNVPIEAVNAYLTDYKIIGIDGYTTEMSRRVYEDINLDINDVDLDTTLYSFEKGSYFIRTPEQNPNHYWNYNAEDCKTFYHESEGAIIKNQLGCFMNNFEESFEFVFDTGKFMYTDLGTWHNKRKGPDYYGDSAIIAMGMCKPYYR